MRKYFAVALALTCLASPALAAKKGMRFWNLTSETLAEVALAPAGSQTFGPNQCQNDKDGTVDFDEQLSIIGVAPGRYDIRTRDTKGRICLTRNVDVKANAIVSLRDKDLAECSP
jgi:hypothetical protein